MTDVKRYPGTVIEIAVEFTDKADALFDPDAPTFKVLAPGEGASVETFVYPDDDEVIRDAAGKYHMNYLLELSGDYAVRAEGSGEQAVAVEDSVTVEESAFADA